MIPVRYNLRNLVVRRATTIATAFGVALVVFVLGASLMLREGLRRTLDLSSHPDYAIVLRKGSDAELSSSIDDATVSLIRTAPGVAKTHDGTPLAMGEVVVVLFMELAKGQGKSNAALRGVTADVTALRPGVEVIEGRLPAPGTDEVMVGKAVHGQFKGLQVGQSIELRKNRAAKIVGVFAAGGSSFESEIWGDLDYVRQAFGRDGVVSSVRVKLESPALFDGFSAAIEQDKRLGLTAMTEPEFYRKQSENTSMFIIAIGTILALFFSIGAMIGAMITMYGAVAHRRREVGVLRALGFSPFAIMTSFLFESTLLALLGGFLGCLAAAGLGFVKFSMMNFQTFSEIVFEFEPTPEILGIALFFGATMGLVGGFLPALRAARLPTIDAMRG